MIAEGSLQDFSLSDLLQIISLNAATGTLTLTSDEREGKLACRKGEIVGATATELEGEEAVYALFHWESGAFRFREGEPLELAAVGVGGGDLAREGIRRLDRWRAIRQAMPTMTRRARFRSESHDLPAEVSTHAADVWGVIAGTEGLTLSEVARAAHLPELMSAEALLELFQGGIVQVETSPEEALRAMFARVGDELYGRFASISGLKMTEGLETLLNSLARHKEVELRWRNGKVHDELSGQLGVDALRPIYEEFLRQQLEYVTRIHGTAFTERVLEGVLGTLTPEERASWDALELPENLAARP